MLFVQFYMTTPLGNQPLCEAWDDLRDGADGTKVCDASWQGLLGETAEMIQSNS